MLSVSCVSRQVSRLPPVSLNRTCITGGSNHKYCPEHGFLYVSPQGYLRTPQSRAVALLCISEPWDHILDAEMAVKKLIPVAYQPPSGNGSNYLSNWM